MGDRAWAAVWVVAALALATAAGGEHQVESVRAEAVRLAGDLIPDAFEVNAGSARLSVSIRI